MATTDYEPPWEWTQAYLKDRIRKNTVIEKRRKKVQKARIRHVRG
ncbi:MAG: hypothetical protein ACFFBC_00190 [Promethearchaeota archaeon]